MTQDEGLKSCPFCGGEAEITPNIFLSEYFQVNCRNFGCQGAVGNGYRNKHVAIDAWNTRSPQPLERLPKSEMVKEKE